MKTLIKYAALALIPVGFVIGPSLSLASGTITFSQTNLNLNVGQSTTVTVYPPSGQIANITNITNSSAVSASLFNNLLTVSGMNPGSSQITVCTFDNSCGTISITVNGTSNYGNNLTLSPSSVTMTLNQSSTVTIYNNNNYYSNTYYISSNSNPSVVSANISGSSLTLYGNNVGNTTITVCQNNGGQCGTVYVTVANNYNNYNPITLSPSSLNLYSNQTSMVYISGGNSNYYISSNSNSNIATISISNNQASVYANNTGSTTATVCSYGINQCASLYITVNSNYGTGNLTLTPSSLNINLNQSSTVTIYSSNYYSGYSYYVSNNSNQSVVRATVSGNVLTLYGNSVGNTTLTVCQNNGGQCGTVYVTVGSGTVLGALIYNNGTLINDNGTIYITYKNTKSGFANMIAFNQLGYKLSNVIVGSTASITNTGYVINSANTAHPWGSWIKNGNTVYFALDSGLIPIGNYDTFLNNGGHDNLIVPANAYDLSRLVLSIMTLADPRLSN